MTERIHIFREWYIVICLILYYISFGMVVSMPAVISPILGDNSSEIQATDDQASWFVAAYSIMMPFSLVVISTIMQRFGRRWANFYSTCSMILGSIIIALSYDINYLIVGRMLQGTSFGGVMLSVIIVCEFTHPRRRAVYGTFTLAFVGIGLLIGHSLGLHFGWRPLAWFTGVPAAVGLIGILFWPESPAWLAYKKRFEDCAASFEFTRGKDSESRKELEELITAQRELQNTTEDYGTNLAAIINAFKSKKFLKIIGIVTLLKVIHQTTGGNYFVAFTSEIMLKVAGDRSLANVYIMTLDCFRIISTFTGAIVIKFFDRKVILLWSGTIAYMILSLASTLYYFKSIGSIQDTFAVPILIIIYDFICQVGMYPILIMLQSEYFPLKYRGLGMCYVGIVFGIGETIISKFTRSMLKNFDIHGTFGIFLSISIFVLIILFFVLPETKDKTLQQIENNMIELKLQTKLEYDNVDDKRPLKLNFGKLDTFIIDKEMVTKG